jgi:hypothetical protein
MMSAFMAAIRIVDDWLRSPVSPPSHWRAVMVIAEKWAEQRVLMRAYAESRDQMRPTIVLHGTELAIGPAGVDVNGPWGIHVGENPDGKAQDIKAHFEHAARRLAGSKGNPPRLLDEEPTFEREPTGTWAPGTPRLVPARPQHAVTPVDFLKTPNTSAARVPQHQQATHVAPVRAVHHVAGGNNPPPELSAPPTNPAVRLAPLPRRSGRTRPPPIAGANPNHRTALGYASGAGAQSVLVRLGLVPQVSAGLGRLVDRVVPSEFQIDATQRRVLNALGGTDILSAREISQLIDLVDAVSFMEDLTRMLEGYGVDLIEPAEPQGGEPTYRLRR